MNIAFIIPCFNEEISIVQTIIRCKSAIPLSKIVVVDNGSTDKTVELAKKTGAIILHQPIRGKGCAVKKGFTEILADIYILIDGDNTYDPSVSPQLVNLLLEKNLDMVVGTREEMEQDKFSKINNTYRQGHRFGNQLFNLILKKFFNSHFTDIFSGYRVMTAVFVKSLAIQSKGFDIETEISIHALQLGLATAEVSTVYEGRVAGSFSKLATFKDGIKILFKIFQLFSELHSFLFYSLFSIILLMISLYLGIPVILDFFKTGLVERFPTAFLSSAIATMGVSFFFSGLIIHYINLSRKERKIQYYQTLKYENIQLKQQKKLIRNESIELF